MNHSCQNIDLELSPENNLSPRRSSPTVLCKFLGALSRVLEYLQELSLLSQPSRQRALSQRGSLELLLHKSVRRGSLKNDPKLGVRHLPTAELVPRLPQTPVRSRGNPVQDGVCFGSYTSRVALPGSWALRSGPLGKSRVRQQGSSPSCAD